MSRVPKIAWILSLILFVSIFMPSLLGMDGMKGGYALSVLFGFFCMAAVITALVYGKLNKEQQALFNGADVLVRWKYSDQEWMEFTKKDYEEDKSMKKALFYIISGWAVFFGILFPVLDHENGFFVTLIMIGLIVVIGITAMISIKLAHQKNLRFKGEAIISRNGVFLNGQMHSWRMIGTKLLEVDYKKNSKISYMEFEYLSGQSTYSVRVPVPKGEENRAQEIVEILNP